MSARPLIDEFAKRYELDRGHVVGRWYAAAALVVLLAVCGAPTEFTVALAGSGEFEVDQRLVGTWYGVSSCRDVEMSRFLRSCEQPGGPTGGTDGTDKAIAIFPNGATVAVALCPINGVVREEDFVEVAEC